MHKLLPLQSGMLKRQPTNTPHSLIPSMPQVTQSKGQDWIHPYNVPTSTPAHSGPTPNH